jgi:hypothetical protein
MEKGKCKYFFYKWGISETQNCECGCMQTIRYIIEDWPSTRFAEGLDNLHKIESRGVKWLMEFNVRL